MKEGAGCFVLTVVNLVVGTITAQYDIWVLLGKTIPLWVAILIGFLGGEVTIPVAIVFFVLRIFGMEVPLIK